MAFAILLNTDDFAYIASQLTRPDLDTTDALNSRKMWDGGIRNHGVSPQPPYDQLQGDPNMRIVTITTNNMSSANFVAAMRRMAYDPFPGIKYPVVGDLQNSEYMDALADHIANTKIEPYNN